MSHYININNIFNLTNNYLTLKIFNKQKCVIKI